MSEERNSIARRALGLVDLTDLADDSSKASVEVLCQRAQTPHGPVAAICIWPRFVSHARQQLTNTEIPIATVVNFPSGDQPVNNTVTETIAALDDGADEIDLVMPYRKFMAGNVAAVQAMLVAIRSATAGRALLKVILETGELSDAELIKAASDLAIAAGADFIKTSTGKAAVNATLEAAEIMLGAIANSRRSVGFKPAGGIKSTEDCGAYLAVADRILGPEWVSPATFRFGASSVLDDLLAALEGTKVAPAKGY